MTLDQREGDDEWYLLGDLPLEPGASMRLVCAENAPCIADARYVTSVARYNDGSAVEGSITLAPMDGIILQRIEQ